MVTSEYTRGRENASLDINGAQERLVVKWRSRTHWYGGMGYLYRRQSNGAGHMSREHQEAIVTATDEQQTQWTRGKFFHEQRTSYDGPQRRAPTRL